MFEEFFHERGMRHCFYSVYHPQACKLGCVATIATYQHLLFNAYCLTNVQSSPAPELAKFLIFVLSFHQDDENMYT